MEFRAAEEIIACLPKDRTLFDYFPERYAVYLLSGYVGDGTPISEVKRSAFAKLLARPIIKSVIASKGGGLISRDDLANCWATRPECYLLTLGTWGPRNRHRWNRYYYQTSRPGVNLVLQLNFSSLHNKPYRDLIQPGVADPFQTELHPIARKGFHTLAWARLDIDMDTGEALVEELQTDWLRFAHGAKQRADEIMLDDPTRRAVERVYFNGVEIDPKAMRSYFQDVLGTHIRIWDEALLTAVLAFLTEEIGLAHIYLHDFDSGCRLKGINGRLPPRSLYTGLPARFCFKKTDAPPTFMTASPTRTLKAMLRAGSLRFWRLDLSELQPIADSRSFR